MAPIRENSRFDSHEIEHVQNSPGKFAIETAEVCIIALSWVVLYQANKWLFSRFDISRFISWIFLPAALRVLSVLVSDWRAALGLFVGALITCEPQFGINLGESLVLATLSAGIPFLVYRSLRRPLQIDHDLVGLTTRQIWTMSSLTALASAAMHNLYFQRLDPAHNWINGTLTMMSGDLLGSALFLYLAMATLKLFPHLHRQDR